MPNYDIVKKHTVRKFLKSTKSGNWEPVCDDAVWSKNLKLMRMSAEVRVRTAGSDRAGFLHLRGGFLHLVLVGIFTEKFPAGNFSVVYKFFRHYCCLDHQRLFQ